MHAEVAANLTAARKRAGLAMHTLSLQAGLTYTFVSHIESGRRVPSFTTLAKIAAVLGIDARELLPRSKGGPQDTPQASASQNGGVTETNSER
jgi:transcriptional regulator with XRE-family HTH domain